MWSIIPNSIKELHTLFKNNGKSLYIVGGSVRDFLNKETPKDYDLATDATPDEILLITKDYRNHLHGESFGVVVVYTEDTPEGFEIATFRADQYETKEGFEEFLKICYPTQYNNFLDTSEDFTEAYEKYKELVYTNRNPHSVKFTTIDKDVLRRDLTINALFYDLDKQEVIDLVGGVEDIKNKITRFVGEPTLRIKEDPLRIPRLFRFTTKYGFKIDSESSIAIFVCAPLLSIITKERIWDEIKKAYKQSKNFSDYLELICTYGIDTIIFPGLHVSLTHPNETMNLELHFAYLFQENSTIGLLDKMKFEFKMEHNFARTVVFLINLINLKEETVIELHKNKIICGISDKDIQQWYKLTLLDKSKIHQAFLKYVPTFKAEELMLQGFKNRALGAEIKRLELENFNKIINEI